MSHRTEPPSEELEGAAGCIVFALFLAVETAVAGLAGFAGYAMARVAPLDVGHEIGVALAFIGGLAALWWIDRKCCRLTGHSAGEIAMEFLCWW